MRTPQQEQLPEYYKTYFHYSTSTDLMVALREQAHIIAAISNYPSEKEHFSYDIGKWTVREVIGHLLDTERIFAYRILRFSRKDATPLSGFDENDYIRNSPFKNIPLRQLSAEWLSVRQSTVMLLESLTDDCLDFEGVANQVVVSPRILAFMVFVHAEHHFKVLKERYGVGG